MERRELRRAWGRKEKEESVISIILKCTSKKIKTYFRLLASKMVTE